MWDAPVLQYLHDLQRVEVRLVVAVFGLGASIKFNGRVEQPSCEGTKNAARAVLGQFPLLGTYPLRYLPRYPAP